MVVVLALQHVDVQREPPRGGERAEDVRNVLAREFADRLPAQSERRVRVRPPRQIDDGACQRLVERGVRPPKPVDAAPLAQGAVQRLAQRQRAVLGGVVVVDVEVTRAGKREIEPRVAAERVEQMIEEAEARLHVGLSRAVERERDGDRCLAGGASDGRGARGHGASPSASSVRSRASLSRSKSAASPGSVMRSAVSSPRRSGKSRTSTPAAASRALRRRRSSRTRATWTRSGSAPRPSWARASATDGAATVYGPPAARSTAMTYGLPTAYPTRQPARPQALDSVRSTRTLGRSSTEGVRSSSAYSTYT